MEQKNFLGTGIRFPMQVNPATGRIVMSEGEQSVKESLYLILMTQQGERFTRPEFGSKILSYTFMDTSATMMNLMARDIRETILKQEPRIVSAEVEVYPRLENECLMVDITYQVRESDGAGNMVFPFYLNVLEDKTG